MTDIITALANNELSPFEGNAVVGCKVEIPGAAGGLREALKVTPVEIHHGERVWLAMEVECTKVRFDPVKDGDALVRVHVLAPLDGRTSFVPARMVEEYVDKQAEEVRRERERIAGIYALPGTTPGDSDEFGFEPTSDDENGEEPDSE